MDIIPTLIAELEAALNAHDAVAFNRRFDQDVSWGSPNGELVSGVETLHAIHKSFLDGPLGKSRFRYAIEKAVLLSDDAAYAHVRLTRTNADGTVTESDERCLYVLAKRQDRWWLCAGHNTHIKTGEPSG